MFLAEYLFRLFKRLQLQLWFDVFHDSTSLEIIGFKKKSIYVGWETRMSSILLSRELVGWKIVCFELNLIVVLLKSAVVSSLFDWLSSEKSVDMINENQDC